MKIAKVSCIIFFLLVANLTSSLAQSPSLIEALENSHFLYNKENKFGDEPIHEGVFYATQSLKATKEENQDYKYHINALRYNLSANQMLIIKLVPKNLITRVYDNMSLYVVNWNKLGQYNLNGYYIKEPPEGSYFSIYAEDNNVYTIIIDAQNRNRTFSIFIENESSHTEVDYCLYVNRFDFYKEFGKACIKSGLNYLLQEFIKAGTTNYNIKSDDKNIRTTSNIIMSILSNNNIEEFSKSIVINRIKSQGSYK